MNSFILMTFSLRQDEEAISIQRCATITGSAVYCQVGRFTDRVR